MNTIHGTSNISKPLDASVVTIGNFDGLHKGHRELVNRVLKLSSEYHVPSVVFTFDPHPLEILAPQVGHLRIFTKDDLQEQLELCGVDHLVIEPFSMVFAKTPPQTFLKNFIQTPLRPKAIVVGHDFAFGEKRTGNLEVLRQFCESSGIRLEVVEPVETSEVVSSSKIRQAIRLGKMQEVMEMLERPYYVTGMVVKGDGRGRTIGVPTVNLRLSSDIQPAPGVYVTSCLIDGQWLPSVSNIGCKPTFQNQDDHKVFTVETHLLNFDADLYGETLRIQFHQRLRDEQRFYGVEELVKQIKKDISLAEKWFERHPL